MKKILVFLTLSILLVGCNKVNIHEKENIKEKNKYNTSQIEEENKESIDEQLKVLVKNYEDCYNDWNDDVEGYGISEESKLAVADLNRNGRLEIIMSKKYGTGIYSETAIYEINSDFSGVEQIKAEDGKEHDIIGDWLSFSEYECYKKGDKYYYKVEDYFSEGWSLKGDNIYAYNFDGTIQDSIIAGYKLCPESEESNVINVYFTVSNDNSYLSEKGFIDYINDYWNSYEKQPNVKLEWVEFPTQQNCRAVFQKSFEGYRDSFSNDVIPIIDYKSIYGDSYEYRIIKN